MKSFITLWIGELISSIGSGMIAFAVSIYVYQATGSATWVSVAGLVMFAFAIIFGSRKSIKMIERSGLDGLVNS